MPERVVPTRLYTIGYEGLSADRFMALLARHGIETLMDIRQLPLSRKAGFSKRALSELVQRSGREYVHIVELGCPKAIRDQYRKDGDWSRYVEGFSAHLQTQHDKLHALAELSRMGTCALMCYEADYTRCHRSIVAEAVLAEWGGQLAHIVNDGAGTALGRVG